MLRFLGGVLLIAVLCLALGYWLGWLNVGVSKNDRQAGIQVKVDQDKIKEDFASLRERVAPLGTRELKGKLLKVDGNQLTIENGQTTTILELTDQTNVMRGAQAGTRQDLRPGMDVTVHYVVQENRNQARTIQVPAS